MKWNRKDTDRKKRKTVVVQWLLAMLLVLNTLFPAYARPAWPNDTGIQSESGIVMDTDSGTVLFAQNIHEPKAPASITKLLTAMVVIDRANMEDEVTFSHDAVYNVESGSGNKMNIEEGDKLTVKDCLYLLLLQSSNQAANALAEHVAGSRDGFVEMMNEKIAELGCTESHFANPSGLNDDNQYVTAYDMAIIGAAAFKNPVLLEIDSTTSYSIPATINNPNGRTFEMEHKLVVTEDPSSENYYPAAVAGKTGYTSIAGQTLVTYAEKDGRKLVAVTLKSSQKTHYSDTKTLLEFGFSRFKNVNISENETSWVTGEEPLSASGEEFLPSELFIDEGAVISLPNEAGFGDGEKALTTDLPDGHPEQAVARIDYTYNERKIGSAWVYTTRPMTAPAANQEEQESQGEEEPREESIQPESQEQGEEPGKRFEFPRISLHIPPKALLTGGGALLLAAAGVGALLWYRKKQKEEKERQRIRKEKRRKRLEEMGCSEEEFARMMDDKRNGRNTGSGENEPIRQETAGDTETKEPSSEEKENQITEEQNKNRLETE